MLDTTKEIVIALINNNKIGNNSDVKENIEDVKLAIKEINQLLLNARLDTPQINKN